MRGTTKEALRNKVIATQCQLCSHTFNLSTAKINTFEDGITQCPSCQTDIKITFCPHCDISYSIVVKNLKPGRYATSCKRCNGQFAISIPEVKVAENKKDVKDAVAKNLVERDETSSVKEQLAKPKPTSAEPAAFSAPQNRIKEQIAQRQKQVEGQRPFQHYSLKKLANGIFISLQFSHILLAAAFITLAALATGGAQFALGLIFAAKSMVNPYIKSYVQLLPLTMNFALFVAFASLVARDVLLKIMPGQVVRKNSLELFVGAFFNAFFAGAPALFAISTLLTFLARIPSVGTLVFSLIFLPIYAGGVLMTLLLTAGSWFLPVIIARYAPGPLALWSSFFAFLKRYNFRLLYIVPTLFMLAASLFLALSFFHAAALSIVKAIAFATAGENVSKAFAGIPVLMGKLASYSLLGEHSDLLNFLTGGGEFAAVAGGSLIGIVLALVSIFIYAVSVAALPLVSAHVYVLLEKESDSGDKAKLQLFFLMLTMWLTALLIKIAIF